MDELEFVDLDDGADDDGVVDYSPKVRRGQRATDAESDGRFADVPTHVVENNLDPSGDAEIFAWLRDHPDFIDRPATIEQFLGPKYLNIEDSIRPGVRKALVGIFGLQIDPMSISEKRRAMMTGAIGIGKTTFASIAIPYMVHWVLCLHDPQKYFGLMPGSRIAFMLMSTTDSQAKEVLFGDIKARLAISPWFRKGNMYSDKFKNQLRFPKDIWVLPGNSQETTFEGYNILGGILDEGDSHKITDNKDYAQGGWDTIHSRISSRFDDPISGSHRGLLIAIGQMKSASGFMSRKKKELENDPDASVVTMTIWESFGWSSYKINGKYDVFWYDIGRKEIVSAEYARDVQSKSIIPIPNSFKQNFVDNPVKALRDLAGIPPEATDPFIQLMDRVKSAMDRYEENHADLLTPVNESCSSPAFHERLQADNALPRALSVDIAYSDAISADALGMAMGHVPFMVELDGDLKPYIVFDMLLRIKAVPGRPIMLSEMRQLVYELKDRRGFRIKKASLDGMQSLDTLQAFNKRKISAEYLSVDRNKAPYEDLREAIYENRIEFPRYVTYIRPGSTELVVIAQQELQQLNDTGKKIDHPVGGSKDVTDAMAAVTHILSGSSEHRRGRRTLQMSDQGGWVDGEVVSTEYETYDPTSDLTVGQDALTAFLTEDVETALGKSKTGRSTMPRIGAGIPELGPGNMQWG